MDKPNTINFKNSTKHFQSNNKLIQKSIQKWIYKNQTLCLKHTKTKKDPLTFHFFLFLISPTLYVFFVKEKKENKKKVNEFWDL